MQKKEQILNWNPQLDGIRGIAVLFVMLSHWIPERWQFGIPFGTAGVQLFFVLSGFLITSILLRCRDLEHKTNALIAFYVRRALRIFPLFFVVLAATTYLGLIPWQDTFPWHSLYLSNILFFLRNEWGGSASHFWSLAVEEQFYLLWPCFVIYCPKKLINYLPIGFVLMGLALRIAFQINIPDRPMWVVLLPSNLTSFALGALIAARPKVLDKSIYYLIPSLLTIDLSIRLLGSKSWILDELEFHLMLLAFANTIRYANTNSDHFQSKILANPCLMYLGTVSYGLYILHNFAWFPLQRLTKLTGLTQLNNEAIAPILMFVITLIGAIISWTLLEKPILKMKTFFPYGREK